MTPEQLMAGAATSVTIVSVSPVRYSQIEKHTRYATGPDGNILTDAEGNLRVSHIAHYTLEPAPRGGYSKLVITPAFQMVRDPSNIDGESFVPRPIPAKLIADSLVDIFTQHVLGAESGSYPGVGIVAGDEPTEAELDALRSSHEAYARFLVTQADQHYNQGNPGNITDTHRQAAAWLNVENSNDHPWVRVIRASERKDCIACGEEIKVNVGVCKHCRTNLADYAIENQFELEDLYVSDAFTARIVERRLNPAPKAAKTAPKRKVEVQQRAPKPEKTAEPASDDMVIVE